MGFEASLSAILGQILLLQEYLAESQARVKKLEGKRCQGGGGERGYCNVLFSLFSLFFPLYLFIHYLFIYFYWCVCLFVLL